MPIKVKVINAEQLERIGQLIPQRREQLKNDLFNAARAFGLDAVARAKRDYLRGPKGQHVMSTGALKASITEQTTMSGEVITTRIGSNLIYAAIQEFGGTTKPTVTDRMRKFAWAMFYTSGDEKWKRLALTRKNQLKIKIPERPYLRPALKDAMPTFSENISKILRRLEFA